MMCVGESVQKSVFVALIIISRVFAMRVLEAFDTVY